MELPNNGETEPQLDISYQQIKLPVPGMGYISSSCWPKGFHENPQTTQSIDKAIGCSPETYGKDPLLKTPAQLSDHRENELMPT